MDSNTESGVGSDAVPTTNDASNGDGGSPTTRKTTTFNDLPTELQECIWFHAFPRYKSEEIHVVVDMIPTFVERDPPQPSYVLSLPYSERYIKYTFECPGTRGPGTDPLNISPKSRAIALKRKSAYLQIGENGERIRFNPTRD